jgi:hypothetical protein
MGKLVSSKPPTEAVPTFQGHLADVGPGADVDNVSVRSGVTYYFSRIFCDASIWRLKMCIHYTLFSVTSNKGESWSYFSCLMTI